MSSKKSLNILTCGAIHETEVLLRRIHMINLILSYNTLIVRTF